MTETTNFPGTASLGPSTVSVTHNIIRYTSTAGMDSSQVIIDFSREQPVLASTLLVSRFSQTSTTYEYKIDAAGKSTLMASDTVAQIPAHSQAPVTHRAKDYGDPARYHFGTFPQVFATIRAAQNTGPETAAVSEKIFHYLQRPENQELKASVDDLAKELSGKSTSFVLGTGRSGLVETARQGMTRAATDS